MTIKIDLSRYETYQSYMKRNKISKQALNGRIISGKAIVKEFPELKLKLICK